MTTVSVKVEGLKEAMAMFDPKKVAQAKKYALREVGSQARVEGNKAITDIYNIQRRDFKTNVVLGKVQDDEISILITASRRGGKGYYGIPLSYFGAVQMKGSRLSYRSKSKTLATRKFKGASGQGVTVLIRKDGKVAQFPNAFVAKMKSGHVGVFLRSKDKKMTSNPKKAAIMELAEVSFPSLFSSKSGADKEPLIRMKKKAVEAWPKVFFYKLEDVMGVKFKR